MKLTAEQVLFLEKYLIKNKVKYWDIRVELLDHIATAIEKRMELGIDFEEALKEEHISFGNTLVTKKLSSDQRKWITNESLYTDNSGYKRLIMQKQKELNRRFRRSFFIETKILFKNPLFLICYVLVMWTFYKAIDSGIDVNYLKKIVLSTFLFGGLIPVVWQIKIWFIDKKNSLYLNLLNTLPLLFITISNLLSSFKIESIWVYYLVLFCVSPFMVGSIISMKKHLKHYNLFYQKWQISK